MKEPNIIVNILGTDYQIFYQDENPKFESLGADGIIDTSTKKIYIKIQKPNMDDMRNLKYYQDYVLRHEIIHAFLYESGLDTQTHETDMWARNEEMIDWLAIQFKKIQKVFRELGI